MLRLEELGSQLVQQLEEKNAARERALTASRELTRSCALSIRAVHRGENERARELRDRARAISDQMVGELSGHPDLRFAGYVQDSQKELVEAHVTYCLINREPLPTREELGVEPSTFLGGMGESVGELRRYILDKLRHGDMERCEEILQTMDEIYGVLVTIDFPDALTGGLRRITDSVRGIMEKTRGDLTNALRQRDLETALRQLEARAAGQQGQPGASVPIVEDPEFTELT